MSYKTVTLNEFGGPSVLVVENIASIPEPGPGEVRVKVLACSASYTDTLIRRGIYPDVKQKPPHYPGLRHDWNRRSEAPQGVSAVFDSMGGDHFKRSLKVIASQGTLVAYGSYNAMSSAGLIKDFLRVRLWGLLPWLPSTAFYSIGPGTDNITIGSEKIC